MRCPGCGSNGLVVGATLEAHCPECGWRSPARPASDLAGLARREASLPAAPAAPAPTTFAALAQSLRDLADGPRSTRGTVGVLPEVLTTTADVVDRLAARLASLEGEVVTEGDRALRAEADVERLWADLNRLRREGGR